MSPIPSIEVAVIGSGVSGLTAAVTLAEGGARVAVFEKQRSLGGTSNFFQGIFAVESELQRERYITYTRDQAFQGIMEYSHWRANPRLVRAIVDESASTIGWLQKCGVVFSDATNNMPESPGTYHVVKGKGEAAIKALALRAKDLGVNIFPGAPVKRLVKAGNRISGVVVESNEEETQVAVKAVIIASGGYANNKEWIKKYTGFDLDVNLLPVGNVDKMGDGIRMAYEVGAGEEGIGVLELFRVGPIASGLPMSVALEHAGIQPDLWVNGRGERFCDESVAFYDTSIGNVNARNKEGYTFSLFDSSIAKQIMERGVEKALGTDFPPGTRFPQLERDINVAIEQKTNEVFQAESVEELAEKMGVKPEVLKSTVEEYNTFCARGRDELFAKDRRYLRPLIGPRYYALKARTVFLGTMGGIRINHRIEVIDKKDNVIPGLYAVGFDAGGMYGDGYCIRASSGLATGFAVNSGRIAGRNALKYIKTMV